MPDLSIDIQFDLVCPWCLIGKRHLLRALELLRESDPDVSVTLRWFGGQLLPDLPAEGLPFSAFYEQRLGSKAAVKMRQAQVIDAARAAGVELAFDRIATMPNTSLAHQLLAHAQAIATPAQYDALLERLFSAYFQRGENIGDRTTLLAIAKDLGLESAGAVLNSLPSKNALKTFPLQAAEGVPYFLFNGRFALSGAHPAEVLHAAMRELTGRLTA